jgi:hypothetical protein
MKEITTEAEASAKDSNSNSSKSIVERIDFMDYQIAQLQNDVKELKAVFYLVKNNTDNNN